MALLAEICMIDTDEDNRIAHRRTVRLQVQATSSQSATGALIHNLSERGLLIETTAGLQVGETLHVDLPEAGSAAALVIWTHGAFFGCGFVSPVSKAAVSAVLLRSPAKHPIPAAVKDPFVGTAVERVDRAFDESLASPNSSLLIFSLLLMLSVVSIFILALLSFPFAS